MELIIIFSLLLTIIYQIENVSSDTFTVFGFITFESAPDNIATGSWISVELYDRSFSAGNTYNRLGTYEAEITTYYKNAWLAYVISDAALPTYPNSIISVDVVVTIGAKREVVQVGDYLMQFQHDFSYNENITVYQRDVEISEYIFYF